ncbi:MAG: hypothetical protein IJI26_06255, partial [Clostridia bacterium]|nr:hypothetical protein [Clostridia bacterium]
MKRKLFWPALLAALLFAVAARADSGIDSWSALQEAVDRAESGAVVILSRDLTALESEATLN